MKPLAALLCLTSLALAETVKDREGAVRGDKAKFENDARWNYCDLDTGFQLAKTTKKPLLVVLRCVPCMSCAGMDAAVRLYEKVGFRRIASPLGATGHHGCDRYYARSL